MKECEINLSMNYSIEKLDIIKETPNVYDELDHTLVNSFPHANFFPQDPIPDSCFNISTPKKEFFLYTIHEHEALAQKTFNFKRKLFSHLSKSDSNIYNSCQDMKTKNNFL